MKIGKPHLKLAFSILGDVSFPHLEKALLDYGSKVNLPRLRSFVKYRELKDSSFDKSAQASKLKLEEAGLLNDKPKSWTSAQGVMYHPTKIKKHFK